jgi:hypothetical protein
MPSSQEFSVNVMRCGVDILDQVLFLEKSSVVVEVTICLVSCWSVDMGVVSMEFLFGVTDQMSVVGLSDSEVPKAVMLRLNLDNWLHKSRSLHISRCHLHVMVVLSLVSIRYCNAISVVVVLV